MKLSPIIPAVCGIVFLATHAYGRIAEIRTSIQSNQNNDDEYQAIPFCVAVTITPEKPFYDVSDTVTITVQDTCRYDIYAMATLQTYRDGRAAWRTIIDDLETYWDDSSDTSELLDITRHPVASGAAYTIRVSMTDIAASFPAESRLRFTVALYRRRGDHISDAGVWLGSSFMLKEPSAAQRVMLDTLAPRGRTRDTLFTYYDSIGNTPVIPSDVLEKHPYRLLITDPFDTARVPAESRTCYRIRWNSESDGVDLELTVTPRQIWVRSESFHPAMGHLFWITDITELQYRNIVRMLEERKQDFQESLPRSGFSRSLQWEKAKSTLPPTSRNDDETWQKYRDDAMEKLQNNTRRLVTMFNSGLAQDKRIPAPVIDGTRSVRWELPGYAE